MFQYFTEPICWFIGCAYLPYTIFRRAATDGRWTKGAMRRLRVQPVESPDHENARHAAVSHRLAAVARFVCLSFGETLRTAGNEGVPLQ